MTPVDYLREAFRIIETNAYYQPSPAMWRPLKTRLLTEAEQAQNIPAVYPRTYDSHIRPDMTCHDALTAAQVWLSRQT